MCRTCGCGEGETRIDGKGLLGDEHHHHAHSSSESRMVQVAQDILAKAIQVNTGKGCHLDDHMTGHALEQFAPFMVKG